MQKGEARLRQHFQLWSVLLGQPDGFGHGKTCQFREALGSVGVAPFAICLSQQMVGYHGNDISPFLDRHGRVSSA